MRFYPYTPKVAEDGWTKEHVIPSSRGGGRHRNIVLAHQLCNSKRSDGPVTEDMEVRCKLIWNFADTIDDEEVEQTASCRVLRGTYLWAYRFPTLK